MTAASTAQTRRAISKKVRFEIFWRDNFTCRYCGCKPPDVILEVDHIEPVSLGGSCEFENLLTSCFDCNRGKSNRRLSSPVPTIDAEMTYLKAQQDIAEARRYIVLKRELTVVENHTVEEVLKRWKEQLGWKAPDTAMVRRWLRDHSPIQIEDAICALAERAMHPDFRLRYDAVSYVRGILSRRGN